jgi:hypothetical protein
MDMLHTIYLGIFMRLRDGFFNKLVQPRKLAHDIERACKGMVHVGRQSRENIPKSKFSKGIMGGKLMAKEFENYLLLAVILRSQKGRRLLRSAKLGNFAPIISWTTGRCWSRLSLGGYSGLRRQDTPEACESLSGSKYLIPLQKIKRTRWE